jgi:hypothetical protein
LFFQSLLWPREGARQEQQSSGTANRPQLRHYFSKTEVQELAEELKRRAVTDHPEVHGRADFGKTPQPLTGPDGRPIQIQGVVGNFVQQNDETAERSHFNQE